MRKIRLIAVGHGGGCLGDSAASLYALDVADVTREWTPEGKKLAAERVKLPAHDEMMRIPAGEFIMGSDKKDRQELLSGRVPAAEGLSGCL